MAAAHGVGSNRWSAHPWRARSLRLLVYGLPVAFSVGFVHVVTSVTSTPTSSLWIYLGWWLAVSLAATAVVSLVYAATRRLLPLGALLELSLVFPDEAPSRFRVALRTGTVASLEERVRLLREAKEAPTTQQAAEILLQLVAALNDHDRITAGHADRVRAYSHALGKSMGLAKSDLDRLNWAALLHDIGKLQVSEEILNKTGRPTDEDWASLRLHPLFGETIVAPLREWLGEWIDAVGHHHERWDGTGYPRGLAGDAIPRAGRIVAIADVFDVITSSRSYKDPASPADARSELVRHAGTQFDPQLVRAFVDLSLGKMRLVVGPLAWLAHAPLLARIPLASPVGAALGGVAAVVTTTGAVLAGPADSPRAAVVRDGPAPPAQVAVVRRQDAPTDVARPRKKAARPSGRGDSGPPQRPSPTPTSPTGGASPDPAPPAPTAPEGPDPTPDAPPSNPPGAPSDPAPEPSPEPPAPDPSPPPPPPNQAPSFSAGNSQTVLEDAGAQAVSSWATAISPGPESEASQGVSFTVTTDKPGLFEVPPAISADGTLTYAPASEANGTATVSVTAHDDGGTADGGVDSSEPVSFTIAVEPVNDAPTCSIGGNQTAISVLGEQSVPGFANGSPGPANESNQSVSFVVSTDKPGLFVVPPAITPSGTLTYTPRVLGLGVATVTVTAVDNGGTANGGIDRSASRTFTITIV